MVLIVMIEIALPDLDMRNDKSRSVKDLVFSILSDGNSRTITQLHKEIKKLYGYSVSFQAVMKSINSLIEKKVLIRDKMNYTISSEWIFESRNFLDRLYRIYFNVSEPVKKVELGKEIVVYTVNNLLELDRLWSDLLTNWAKTEINDKRNVWSGRHCWWLIPRLQEEDMLHDLFKKNKIRTYNLLFENNELDKVALNYYKHKGENVTIRKKSYLVKDLHVSCFGETLVKFEIPEKISKDLEKIYSKTKNISNLNLKVVLDIFKENEEIEVTVIKDKFFADKLKEEIIKFF